VVLSDIQLSFDVVHAVWQSLFVPMFCGVIGHVLYKRLGINGYRSFVVSPDVQLFYFYSMIKCTHCKILGYSHVHTFKYSQRCDSL